MAILDNITKTTRAAAATVSGDVSDSLNIADGGAAVMSNPSGPGGDLYCYIKVTAANTGTATSGTFEVIGASNDALSADVKVLASLEVGDVSVTCLADDTFVLGPLSKVRDTTTAYVGTRFNFAGGTSAGMTWVSYFSLAPPDANINNPA